MTSQLYIYIYMYIYSWGPGGPRAVWDSGRMGPGTRAGWDPARDPGQVGPGQGPGPGPGPGRAGWDPGQDPGPLGIPTLYASRVQHR